MPWSGRWPLLRAGDRLEWRRVRFEAPEWTLLHRGEPIADLVPSEWRRFDARGEAGSGVWLFRRLPWRIRAKLEVVDSASGRCGARYVGLGWRRGRIVGAAGASPLLWRRRWGRWNTREVREPGGTPLLTLRYPALRPTRRGSVVVHRRDRGGDRIPLLLLLSWYLHLRVHTMGASPLKPFGGGRRGWEPWEAEA